MFISYMVFIFGVEFEIEEVCEVVYFKVSYLYI